MARPYPTAIDPAYVRAAVAVTRFGYGARPGELSFIAEDPDQWLLDQLEQRTEVPNEIQGLPRSDAVTSAMMAGGGAEKPAFLQAASLQANEEAARHALLAINGDEPFRERLVRFWANFFSVSAQNPRVLPLAHSFEREVIRPNLGARFYDMLLAASRHPAMLFQYEQASSVGPNSRTGRTGRGGVNLDFAEALLERFTLSTGASDPTLANQGFGQSDIRELAKMLTGWSVAGPGEKNPGQFRFRPEWHEHGRKKLLGRIFPEADVLEGEAALDTLVRRIETGRHLAERMVRYFIADDPPPSLVAELVHTYADTGGSLRAITEKMLVLDASWVPTQHKVKTPEDLVISAMRAVGANQGDGARAVRAMTALGQAPKMPPGPDGWPDSGMFWLDKGRLGERLDVGAALGRLAAMALSVEGGGTDGAQIGFATLGPLLRKSTYRRLVVSPDLGEQLALLFASPEFQRR